jgi:hypothetical protein
VAGSSRRRCPHAAPARTDLDDVALVQAVDGEVGQLTDWLTDYLPARTTMLLGSGLTLAAIASRSWFVALLVLAATPLLPANLKVIGLGTQTAVRAQLTAIRTDQARLLDHLRGLPTLVGLGAHDQAAGCPGTTGRSPVAPRRCFGSPSCRPRGSNCSSPAPSPWWRPTADWSCSTTWTCPSYRTT